jgi:uncharacterized protein YjbJ (UPF0337 family)
MKGTLDIAKGRIEEAAGALTGSSKLRAKGQRDQAIGQVKRAADKGVRQVKEAARTVVAKVKSVGK